MVLQLVEALTQDLVQWARNTRQMAPTRLAGEQALARKLGGHLLDGHAVFGFWVPSLFERGIEAADIVLEILRPLDEIVFSQAEQTIRFERTHLPLTRDGDYLWGMVAGVQPGSKHQPGDFYWLHYHDQQGRKRYAVDPLAYSVPFGVKAPAEFYDVEAMFERRQDASYFHHQLAFDPDHEVDQIPRLRAPTNILEIHVGTASAEGTIAGLTHIYRTIADKIYNHQPLSAAELHYIGYDAIQLMPIEPPIEHEAGPAFWQMIDEDERSVTVHILEHDIIDWGYDVMVTASPATNPAILDTKRPDELLELIEVLHNFPQQPIKLIFDIVYGHTDNQAVGSLDEYFLAGANMYGQNLSYRHPTVRAILLEMQRRKHNYGIDGIRVDGAQDFKWWDDVEGVMVHDDDMLRLMNNLTLEVNGVTYRPWMIFEDGRPWPRDDWELSSTYHEVTRQMPNVWQWGPLSFAHNTPFLFTFWISKWWRIREMTAMGSHWITGCANHDTLRRGAQVSPEARVNTYLGDSLSEVFKNGYDNPAAKLFDYAMMPGIPMDFINASMRGPWGFTRNTDDKFGVKVMSEEVNFTHWCMTPEIYADPAHFDRLKAMGFTSHAELQRFITYLDRMVQATYYDLPTIVEMLNSVEPVLPFAPYTSEKLKMIAYSWMEDVHDYCNVAHYWTQQSRHLAEFNLAVREFRRQRHWLMKDLGHGEFLDYQHPVDGTVLFYGRRLSPDQQESLFFVANMEGAPRDVNLASLFRINPANWTMVLKTPDLDIEDHQSQFMLANSQGVVFRQHAV